MAKISIALKPCVSSQVTGFGYDATAKILRVQFKGGSTYDYKNVPPDVAAGMEKCESVGKYLHTNIKGAGYEFERLPSTPAEAQG